MLTPQTYQAYQVLCAFCSWALYADPEPDRVRAFAAERELFLEDPFAQVAPAPSQELAGILASTLGEQGDDVLRELHLDRSYLFYMVGSSKVSPFESVWRTDDATMFGPQTLAVREAYHEHGLAFDHEATEPDDHVGIEFSFCAHLLGRAADGNEGADAALRAFLAEHLLVFGPLYLAGLEARAKTDWYRCVARIAASTLDAMACAFDVQPCEQLDVAKLPVA